jgi:uncharacterized protein (UPF0261 family)
MKTVVLIGTCDTKQDEITFVRERLLRHGIRCLVMDVSTRPGSYVSTADFPPETVFSAGGMSLLEEQKKKKFEILHAAAVGAAALTDRLYRNGDIQGAISIGGLQNSNIGCFAMQALPLGVPKVMVSTVACGQRVFEPLVGTRDITIFPSISDFTGVNSVSAAILSNAVAALAGMLRDAGQEIRTTGRAIGTTLMGATNDGVVNAVKLLQTRGYEVISFHSTGAGGRIMEELVETGAIGAVMDLTLHEVVYEYFGFGFGYGASGRTAAGARKGIPMLICPGGIDFMCQWKWQMFDDIDSRIWNWHNETLSHVKLRPAEAVDISNMIIDRLNTAVGPVEVIFPTQGLRNMARPGEELYDPAVDRAILDTFAANLRPDIPLKQFDANFCDPSFSRFAAEEMITMMEAAYGV